MAVAHVSIHPFYPILLVDSEIVTYTCQFSLLDMTASITVTQLCPSDLFRSVCTAAVYALA